MGTTPNYGIPYPEPTDKPKDIAAHFKNLADGLDAALTAGATPPPPDSGWISVSSFSLGWTAQASVRYRKLGGIVFLQGRLTGGTSTGTAFTLPAGYRPNVTGQFAAISGTTTGLARVVVNSAGAVQLVTGETPNLDGISFPADN